MRRAIVVTLFGFVAVTSTACSSDSRKDLSQCKLVSAADVAEAIGGTSASGRVFEHEESGDGTWCLYETSIGGIETRFEQGTASEFRSEKERCLRGGAPSNDLSTESEQLVYCATDGIPRTIALTGGYLVRVQALDRQASQSTVAIVRTAIRHCCPSD